MSQTKRLPVIVPILAVVIAVFLLVAIIAWVSKTNSHNSAAYKDGYSLGLQLGSETNSPSVGAVSICISGESMSGYDPGSGAMTAWTDGCHAGFNKGYASSGQYSGQ